MPEKKQSAWRYLWYSIDIRKKLLFTLGILILFRLAANVPAPGVNRAALEAFFQSANGGGFLGFLNLLSGGTIKNFSVLAMGVYPYITAQIILQLLIPIIPSLQQRMQDDQREGRQWMEKWTYYLAVPMAMLSAIGQINTFNALVQQQTGQVVIEFGFTKDLWLSSVTTLLVMTAGTMFAIWLGELISEYGIRGQGLSLVIFAGIVSQIPGNFFALRSLTLVWPRSASCAVRRSRRGFSARNAISRGRRNRRRRAARRRCRSRSRVRRPFSPLSPLRGEKVREAGVRGAPRRHKRWPSPPSRSRKLRSSPSRWNRRRRRSPASPTSSSLPAWPRSSSAPTAT